MDVLGPVVEQVIENTEDIKEIKERLTKLETINEHLLKENERLLKN